ncbi:MAG: cytidylate kinase-like family protein [Bacteroidia bacterium]|nr:cytidylate kinase-like family protein [Bacteroidia bacterium]
MGHNIINVGRQFGSGGKRVATALSEKLGIPVYDNELIAEAAAKSGYSKDLFKRSDERKRVFSLSNIFGTTNRYSMGESYLNDNQLFKLQSEVIREIAENGPAIFVGRASDYVLRDLECLDVFISAPLEERKKAVAEREGMSLEDAEAFIIKQDRKRQDYYNFFTFGNWGVASNYDLCIDSSILGIDGTADFIIDFGKKSGLLR